MVGCLQVFKVCRFRWRAVNLPTGCVLFSVLLGKFLVFHFAGYFSSLYPNRMNLFVEANKFIDFISCSVDIRLSNSGEIFKNKFIMFPVYNFFKLISVFSGFCISSTTKTR